MLTKSRPKFLNLFAMIVPMSITAKISILHRISGVLLVLLIPALLYVFHQSLISPSFYQALYGICNCTLTKLFYLVLLAAFIYHLCAGVRFLFLDIHYGVNIKTAKKTSYLVLLVSIILTAVLGVFIW